LLQKKRRFGGGRQPKVHATITPVQDRVVKCPCCRQSFTVLHPDPPGAYRLEAARHYIGGVSAPTFRRLIKRGMIRPNRALRILTFWRGELDRYLKENTEGP